MSTWTIKLWYADGHLGEYTVEADEQETAIATAWAKARRAGLLILPMAHTRAEVLSVVHR